MKSKFLFVGLTIFSIQYGFSQTADVPAPAATPSVGFSSVVEGKQKIEKTVPLVIKHVEEISKTLGDPSILSNTKSVMSNEYGKVASELELYKYNMSNCALLSSKKATSCMNYHTSYFKNTLENYNNYITNISKKNAFYNMADENIQLDLNPAEISKKMNMDFGKSIGAVKSLKRTGKKAYFETLKNDDYKLSDFNSLLN